MEVLELFYSWQAVIVAVACIGITKLVTTVLEMAKILSHKGDGPVWTRRLLLPLLPICIGFLVAAFVPLRPEFLVHYITTHVEGWWNTTLSYGAWGAACGQFAGYSYDRLKALLEARKAE